MMTENQATSRSYQIRAQNRSAFWWCALLAIAGLSVCTAFGQICSLNADGTGLRQLAAVNGIVSSIAFSPDGTKLAFSSSVSGHTEVFLMASNGTNVRQVSPPPGTVGISWPAFTPDGKQLLVTALTALPNPSTALYLMSLDGSSPRLFKDGAFDASYSTDGSKVIFNRSASLLAMNLYTSATDGTNESQVLTPQGISGAHATFNPKNTAQIAYSSVSDSAIWVQKLDGTQAAMISQPPGGDVASFSPTGEQIIYSSGKQPMTGHYWIFENGLTGGVSKQLATVPFTPPPGTGISIPLIVLYPVFSPDGKTIACKCTPPAPAAQNQK